MNKKLCDFYFGQVLCVLIEHLKISFLFAVLSVMAIPVLSYKIGSVIFGIIGMAVYSVSMYCVAADIFNRDNKTFTPLTPKPWKGIILPLLLLCVNAAVIIIYKSAWTLCYTADGWTSGWGLAGNMLGIVWFSAYYNAFNINHGVISTACCTAVFAVPVVMCTLGYYLNYKGVYLSKYLYFIKYEKKK